MDLVLKEKFAVCYTCCGPTYRESAYKQIKENYFDNDDLYFCVLTDDKEYFNGLERKNLIVNELNDFYDEFPVLEKNEYFLEGDSKTDYATKFVGDNYLFPFSTIRFNILQAIKLGVKNVAFLCTDTHIDFTKFSNDIFDKPNNFYNAVSEWDSNSSEHGMDLIVKILKEDFDLKWFDICALILGETFGKTDNVSENINGLSISPKKNYYIIRIWIKNNNIANKELYNFNIPSYSTLMFKTYSEML
jgi:hypothetical protein